MQVPLFCHYSVVPSSSVSEMTLSSARDCLLARRRSTLFALKQHFCLSRSTNGREVHVSAFHHHQADTCHRVKQHWGHAHFHFLLIMSFLCLSLHPDSALCLLISEYIINNLHIISFVLIIFVWRNVSLHGERWGYLPHLGAQGTPFRVCCVVVCD